MARGVKKEITYTGKALKAHEKVLKLEVDLKAAKEELKTAYKEQIKAEKAAEAKTRKEEAAAKKKAEKEAQDKLMKAIKALGKTPEEILALLEQ